MVWLSAHAGQKVSVPSAGTSQLQSACPALWQSRQALPSAMAMAWSPCISSAESVSAAGRKPSWKPQRMQEVFSK